MWVLIGSLCELVILVHGYEHETLCLHLSPPLSVMSSFLCMKQAFKGICFHLQEEAVSSSKMLTITLVASHSCQSQSFNL